jgi:peptide/nickel transport system permease protein
METHAPALGPAVPQHDREWLRTLVQAVRTRRGAVGLSLVAAVVAVAAIGPLVAGGSSTAFVTSPFGSPTPAVPLGGDVLGRDVLTRVLNGGWVLLIMAGAATTLGVGLGSVAGVAAAYLKGKADTAIMRTVDVLLAFPQLVFVLLLVSVIGPKLWLIVLAVGLSHAPQVARVLRSAALGISERDFVKAVEIWGVRRRRVMVGEILPNLITPLMVEVGLRLTYSVVIIASLSFLGFGQQPPAPNWGVMVNENRIGIVSNPWAVVVPVAILMVLTVGINTFTDAVTRVAIGVDRPTEEAMLMEGLTLEGFS